MKNIKKQIFCLTFFGIFFVIFSILMQFTFDGIPNVAAPSFETVCSVVYGASVVLFLLFGSLFLESLFFIIKSLGGKKDVVSN